MTNDSQQQSTLGKVYINIRRGQSLIKDVARLQHIAMVMIRHGLGEIIERLNLQDSVILRAAARRSTTAGDEKISTPRRLYLAFAELGPTFIKFGQILSTRPDIFPAEYVAEFEKLQDQVAPLPPDEIRQVLAQEMGQSFDAIFASFDYAPAASASIAQVHRALLTTGEDVAVKVRRPGVKPLVESDINILHFFARRLEATFPEIRLLNLTGIVTEFERAIMKELDFRVESRNLDRFRRMFAGNAAVRIPRPFPEISSDSVLVMEFIEGRKITQVLDDPSIDRAALARASLDIVFTMVLRHGVFHGDLHPGNVFLTGDRTVALLDFGLTGRLTPQMRNRAIDLLLAVTRQDWSRVAEVFYDMGRKTGPVNYDAFYADVADIMDGFFAGRELKEIEVGAFFSELAKGAIRHNMQLPSEYTMMFKALMTMEGIGKRLAPEVDMVAEVKPYVDELLRERYDPQRLAGEMLTVFTDLSRLARAAPAAARQVLANLEQGQLRIGVDVLGWKEVDASRRHSSQLLVLTLLVAGFALSGVLALEHGPPTSLFSLPPLSAIFLGAGAFFFAALLWTFWRGRK